MFSKKTINKSYLLIYIFIGILFFPLSTKALPTLNDLDTEAKKFADTSGFDTTEEKLNNIIGDVIKYFLSFLGVVFLGLLVYGGFTWMRARGDDSAVTIAKETMINAITGLIIVLGSYAATDWVIKNLTESTLK